MKVAAFIFGVVAIGYAYGGVIPAATLVRTPSLDSAVIKSDRVGGNFAYSTLEGHAYTAVSPVVQRVVEPVAVSYTAHKVPLGYVAAPVASYVTQQVVSAPSYLFTSPAISHYPGISFGPVATSPFAPPVGASPIYGGSQFGPIGPQPIADAPPQQSTGTAIDEDTISVESA